MRRVATIVATLSLAAVVAPAVADEVRFVNNEIGYEVVASPGTLTRAGVIADLRRAQRSDELAQSYEFEAPIELAPSMKTREQVQHEAATVGDRERRAQSALYGPNA